MEDGYMTLAEAVAFALEQGGVAVMDSPKQLLSYLSDVMDPDGDEMRVLAYHCDAPLVAPYRDALGRGPEELRGAEARARDYLENERRIEPGTATAIAQGFTAGVGRYQGIVPLRQNQPQIWSQSGAGVPRPRRERTLGITLGLQNEDASMPTTDIFVPKAWPIEPQHPSGNPHRPNLVRGQDLHVDLDITELEAREGAFVSATYDLSSTGESDTCDMWIPAGSTDWSIVRVPEMGDYGAGGGTRGDLIVHLHIVDDSGSSDRESRGHSFGRAMRGALALAAKTLGLTDTETFEINRSYRMETDSYQDTGQGTLVAVDTGMLHTVGLYSDGTALAAGLNDEGQCDVSAWYDLVAVSAGGDHTVGLRSDGTVVAVGRNVEGQCNVFDWYDLVSISAGGVHTVGLRSDGTAVAAGDNDSGQCDVSSWQGLVAVSTGGDHTVGLRYDGTAIATGLNDDGQCDVSSWQGLVSVSAGGDHTVGLRYDGTSVAVGRNVEGQCDVNGWDDLVAVSAGGDHTVGLRSDGTAIAVGLEDDGQCDVNGWDDLVTISAGGDHTVGVCSDGTVVAVGDDSEDQCEVFDW